LNDSVWQHRSDRFQGLSFSFSVRCTDAELGAHIASLLSSLRHRSTGGVEWYSLVGLADEKFDLFLNDERLARLSSAGHAIEWLLWDINRSVAAASNEHLLLHAGAVQANSHAVLFPAPSGAGKSTLVAGLVHHGLWYLSDELIALQEGTPVVLPYPKPLTLKRGSYDLFDGLVTPAVTPERFRADEWYLRPNDIVANRVGGACEAAFVVVPHYVAGGVTGLKPLSDSEAFLAIAINSVNLEKHGESGARALAALVDRCEAYELVMSDLQVACGLVIDLMEARRPGNDD
jgi:hypothetical protein